MFHHCICAVVLIVCAGTALAGDLNPPPGPVTETMKTLDEVEPRVALTQQTAPSDAGYTFSIGSPGSYDLTENIITIPETPGGILVLVEGVTIDFNGFSLIFQGNVDGVNFFDGVSAFNIPDTTVMNGRILSFSGEGVQLGNRSVARNLLVRNSDSAGILVGNASRVESCTAELNEGRGIRVGTSSVATECVSRENGNDGFFGSNNVRFVDCVAESNGDAGFDANDSCSISGCVATGNDIGLEITNRGNIIVRNAASGNTPNYSINMNNQLGTIQTSPVGAGAWDNFDF